jgi:hypothetical protein
VTHKANYNWHIWHKDAKGIRKYMGAFAKSDDAILWKKQQDAPNEYTVTNFGPVAESNPRPLAPNRTPSARRTAVEDPRAVQRKADFERERRNGVFGRKPKAAPKVPDSPEMKRMKADAANIIEGHKADEKADLDKGINR